MPRGWKRRFRPTSAPRWGRAAVLLLVSITTHGFVDRRWPVRRLAVLTGSEEFVDWKVGALIVDQLLHVTVLVGTLAVLL
jgi:hypothetical protein